MNEIQFSLVLQLLFKSVNQFKNHFLYIWVNESSTFIKGLMFEPIHCFIGDFVIRDSDLNRWIILSYLIGNS